MKTKTFFIALIYSLLIAQFTETYSQTPDVLWAKSASGEYWDYGYSGTTDVDGNIITTGIFQSFQAIFGTDTLMNTTSAISDIYLVKYAPSGNVIWAKSAGGDDHDYSYSCATDKDGNIIITGYYKSTSINFGGYVLANAGLFDVFIVKYNSVGNVIWVKGAGGTGFDMGYSCATDNDGNIIATGRFKSSTITFGSTTLTNAGGYDYYIVKYDPSGNVLWAKSSGGSSDEKGLGCSTDLNGNIVATGSFQSTPCAFGGVSLTNAGGNDVFVVKYDTDGNVIWAKSAGGTSNENSYNCATDASGNVIITGDFLSTTLTFETTTLNNVGANDMFISKYDSNGNLLWAKGAGGTLDDNGYSCSFDPTGNIITTGYFKSASLQFGAINLSNAGDNDIYITKYDADGNVLFSESAGGSGADLGYDCFTDSIGNIYTTGAFSSTSIPFGTTVLNNTGTGTSDIFLVKLGGCAVSNFSQNPVLCFGESFTVGGNTYTVSGNYKDTLSNVNGCDSIITTQLTVIPKISTSQNLSICAGLTVKVGNNIYSDSGNYTDSLSNINGCDSIVFTNLNVLVNSTFSQTLTINEGESVQVGNNIYKSAGTYIDTLMAINGCDSVVTTNLTVITGVTEINNEVTVRLYPNPTNGKAVLTFENLQNKSNNSSGLSDFNSIEIYKITGEKIFSSNLENINVLDLTSFRGSIYFIHFKTEHGTFIQKLVITKGE